MPSQSSLEQSPILLFDVNETLLNVQTLRPLFADIFGDGAVLKEWFANLLLYSQTATLAGLDTDFSTLARLALETAAHARAMQLSNEAVTSILTGMKTLPAHSDVPGALQRLLHSGFRLMALTNSSQSVAEAQMQAANLAPMFERIFSVDAVRKFKPHPETYQHVSHELKVPISALTMIAAHPWDLLGAKAAGCNVAFIERPQMPWFYLKPKPLISGVTMDEVASCLISTLTVDKST
ncbi:MAG TPA: haloacid dehalogenase type II [Acidobacteriaceae bacterium]|nr:haloacid dehalogenase type II [Acidobacteriaceae bacterium]